MTLHDLRDLGRFRRRSSLLTRFVLAQSLRRASAVVVPSEFTAGELRQRLGRWVGRRMPEVAVLPGGVGSEFLAYRPQRHFDKPYFLHVGHLERRKNLRLLLDAYALFLRMGEASHRPGEDTPFLVLVGADAGQGKQLEDAAVQLEIADRVRFEGQVGETRLMEYYASCEAVLFPSLYEGFGLPAVEAMAMGKPVFVSNAGALPEVVGNAGVVLPGDRMDAWAHAMETAMEPVDSATKSRGRARAQDLSWDRCAARTLALWRRVAGGG